MAARFVGGWEGESRILPRDMAAVAPV